jgi:histidine phosphotransferase ChpT
MSEALSVSPRVIDLICSRICHDLISPVSAINNGIELITEMDEGVGGDAFSLIADSATVVASRLAVMRYAFGAATPSLDEVRDVALAYFASSKIVLNWPKTGLSSDFTSRQGFPKIILNMVLVLAESIGASGSITLDNPTPEAISVIAEPRTGTIRTDILAGLESVAADNLDARTIQAFVTGLMAKRFGYTLACDIKDSSIHFTLS